MRRILLALAMVALIAVPASAAVQNVKVSGSIESTWLVRDQFTLGNPVFADDTDSNDNIEFYQNLLITQAILRVDADLTDNVSAVIQLINEREWGDEGAKKGWCLYEMGCKGPYADMNCAQMKFNEGTSWPVQVGHGCIACGKGKVAFDEYANNRKIIQLPNSSKI